MLDFHAGCMCGGAMAAIAFVITMNIYQYLKDRGFFNGDTL